MRINNNFNNNRQIDFKAKLICVEGANKELALRLAKIAEKARKTQGDVVLLRQSIRSNKYDNTISSYDIKFNYFKKDSVYCNDRSSVRFTTRNHKKFDMWDDEREYIIASGLNIEEKDNKIVEFFQNYMNLMSNK